MIYTYTVYIKYDIYTFIVLKHEKLVYINCIKIRDNVLRSQLFFVFVI